MRENARRFIDDEASDDEPIVEAGEIEAMLEENKEGENQEDINTDVEDYERDSFCVSDSEQMSESDSDDDNNTCGCCDDCKHLRDGVQK